ncbi:hypothetical protein F52700_2468 [Fusarium sp. NRRL 52700]|nr:hypothetical protein F52700_2468 [Fusarium sp. NRRL 52700]
MNVELREYKPNAEYQCYLGSLARTSPGHQCQLNNDRDTPFAAANNTTETSPGEKSPRRDQIQPHTNLPSRPSNLPMIHLPTRTEDVLFFFSLSVSSHLATSRISGGYDLTTGPTVLPQVKPSHSTETSPKVIRAESVSAFRVVLLISYISIFDVGLSFGCFPQRAIQSLVKDDSPWSIRVHTSVLNRAISNLVADPLPSVDTT